MLWADYWLTDHPELIRTTQPSTMNGQLCDLGFCIFRSTAMAGWLTLGQQLANLASACQSHRMRHRLHLNTFYCFHGTQGSPPMLNHHKHDACIRDIDVNRFICLYAVLHKYGRQMRPINHPGDQGCSPRWSGGWLANLPVIRSRLTPIEVRTSLEVRTCLEVRTDPNQVWCPRSHQPSLTYLWHHFKNIIVIG